MKKISEILFLGGVGGSIYYGIELLFRGFSHWSMFLLGGICMVFMGKQGLWCQWKTPFWKQVVHCTIFVACSEFVTGIIVNKWMRWNVWDYSDRRFQIFGQTCLLFTALFSLLCIVGIVLAAMIEKYLYQNKNEEQ